jgi:hypothetical protein
MAKKKKKRSPGQMHRQVQDSLQALPYYIEQQQKEGKRLKAFMLKYFSAPMLRLMNRALRARRSRGTEGKKVEQTEKMRRLMEQKQMALKHVQQSMQKNPPRKKRP